MVGGVEGIYLAEDVVRLPVHMNVIMNYQGSIKNRKFLDKLSDSYLLAFEGLTVMVMIRLLPFF
jgi:hypothetical protein